MKRTLVKDIPANAISRNELLQRKYPLIAFEVVDKPSAAPQAVGFLVPTRFFNTYNSLDNVIRYAARSISGFGNGNGWYDCDEGKTLVEWLDWFADISKFHVHVFDSEKELFFFLAEKSK